MFRAATLMLGACGNAGVTEVSRYQCAESEFLTRYDGLDLLQ